MSALSFTSQYRIALLNTFIHSFPSKRKLHWYTNIFQTTDSCQRRWEGEQSVLGKNFRLHSRTYTKFSTEIFVARGGLLTGVVNKCRMMKAFLW